MLPVGLWELSCEFRSLPVDRKYQETIKDNYIILFFSSKYKRRWINVILKHNINVVS
jgi:hypothetical protein